MIPARFGEAEGHLIAFAVDRAIVRLPVAHAPGTPLAGTCVEAGETLPLEIKVRSCKRGPDGLFTIDGRPMNLTRAVRDRLTALSAPK